MTEHPVNHRYLPLGSLRRKRLPWLCPCCHKRTKEYACDFEICPVCGWQDDSGRSMYTGANRVHIGQARQNFHACGVTERRLYRHNLKYKRTGFRKWFSSHRRFTP